MPSNLICPKCGREYPWQVPRSNCSTCGTEFTRGVCYVCRVWKDKLWHGQCGDCLAVSKAKYYKKTMGDLDDIYNGWIDKVSAVPKPVKLITEEEWDNACRYFKGCALCDEPQIEARILYIPLYQGGSYTKFNVVPVCEKCATSYRVATRQKTNPYRVMWMDRTKATKERFKNIADYLANMLEVYNDENRSV